MMRGQSKIIGIDLREDSESDEDQECNDADLDARRRAWNANRGSRLTIGRSREGSGFSFFPSAYGFRKSTFENVDKIPTIVVQNAESSPADIVPPIHVTAGPGVSAIPYDIGVSEDNENLHRKESVFNKTRSKVYSNSFTDDAIPAMPIVLPVTASYQQRVSKEARRKTIIWDPIPARNVEPEKEKDIFRRSRTKSYYVEWAFSRVSMWGGPAALFGFDLTQPLPNQRVTLEIRPSLALSEASLSSANFEITKKRRSRQTRLKGARAQDVEASITQNDDYTATHIRGSHPLSGSETLPLTACTNPDSNNIHRSELVVLVNSGELSESPDDRLTQYSANPENFYKARPPSPISARDLKNAEFFASKPGAPLPTWPLTSSLPRRLSVDPAQNFNIISSSENFFSPSQPDASIHTTSSLPRPLSSLEVWKSAERTIESAKAVRSRTLHRYTKASSVRSTEEETIDGTIGGGALGSRGQIMAHASLDRRHGFSDRLLYEMGDGQDGKGQSQSLENFLVAGTNSIVCDDRSKYRPVPVSLQRNKT
ncbi:hypothetical protein BC829DRAFT_379537 [Chytridium lagenaria]|nr:hypothetical protein BC829DRAFT_379537 [Chytridium lagenaria]